MVVVRADPPVLPLLVLAPVELLLETRGSLEDGEAEVIGGRLWGPDAASSSGGSSIIDEAVRFPARVGRLLTVRSKIR